MDVNRWCNVATYLFLAMVLPSVGNAQYSAPPIVHLSLFL
jgi:hypothetical protein